MNRLNSFANCFICAKILDCKVGNSSDRVANDYKRIRILKNIMTLSIYLHLFTRGGGGIAESASLLSAV